MLSTVLLYFLPNNIHLFITLLIFLLTFLVKYSGNAIHSSPQNSKADSVDLVDISLINGSFNYSYPYKCTLLLLWYIKKRSWQPYRNCILNGYYQCSFNSPSYTRIPMHRIAQGHMTHTFLSRLLPTVLQHDKKCFLHSTS